MNTLLFIGHAFHKKTKSSRFMIDILNKKFNVTEFYYDPYTENDLSYDSLDNKVYDIVVCWQILPERNLLNENITFKAGVFFPMYDAGPRKNSPRWNEYRDFLIINFSNRMHQDCLSLLLESIYIQYFPKPSDIYTQGDTNSIFFWNRVSSININTVANLFSNNRVSHLHLHKALDPRHEFIALNKPWNITISESSWYDDKSLMLSDIDKSAFYIAPRPTEGIGMSFLEAMARGRCVIAPNLPTMNEYISHGENGLLYDFKDPQPFPSLSDTEVRAMQNAARKKIVDGYTRWQQDSCKICDWIKEKYIAETTALPKVSIVTVTRNVIQNGRNKSLEKCLRSVQEQRYRGEIEHLIIDGASVDGTLELLKDIPNITVISEPDNGIYDAMNKGLAHASGKYIAFLNSDDFYCSPTAVEDSVRAMRVQLADASCADAYLISHKTEEILASWRGDIELIPFGQYPCHQTLFVKTELLREIGGFDITLNYIADNHVICALVGRGVRIARVNDHIVKFGNSGVTNDIIFKNNVEEEIKLRGQEMFHSCFNSTLTRQECELLYGFRYRELAKNDGELDLLYTLGDKLALSSWRREFWRGLFGQPSSLIKKEIISTKDALRYGVTWIGAILGMAAQKKKLIRLQEILAGRSILTRVINGLRYKRYGILKSIVPGKYGKQYREKYKNLKHTCYRIKLKS